MTHVNEAIISEKELLETGYRKYDGKEMTIFYSKEKCKHAAKCVKGNPEVFEVGRRPWIITDNGEVENNIEVINQCPTGALKYILKEK